MQIEQTVTHWTLNKYHQDRIVCAKIKSKWDLFALLHELGHAFYKHDPHSNDVASEIEAWLYALSCIRVEHRYACTRLAYECIRTYVKHLTQKQILSLLGGEV